LLIIALPFLIAAAPPLQEPLPDDFIVYGISLAAVAAVIVAIARRYFYASEVAIKFLAAGFAVLSYILAANLTVLESLIPSLPTWLPQVLTGILIFGAVLGLAPGETFGKVVGVFRRRR
jgi:hypothetical protein